MRHLLWFRAGRRRADMQGLDTGLDVEASTQLLRTSRCTDVHKGLLRSILSGGVVCGQRACRAGFVEMGICKFCDCNVEESVHHLFWECPAWNYVRSEHQLAVSAWRPDWPACLSCCGLLVHSAILPPPALPTSAVRSIQHNVKPIVLHLDECFIAGKVEVFTDGGCIYNQIPSLRRAGFGGWWADNHHMNFSMPLEGDDHTNNRAELSAVLHVLKNEPRPVHIKTDSAYALRGCLVHRFAWFADGWQKVLHADLWKQLHDILQMRGDSVTVSKVKGHATFEDVQKGVVTSRDKHGNDGADSLANSAAESISLPPHMVHEIKHRRAVVRDMQYMMVEILNARMQQIARRSASINDSDSDSLHLSSRSSTESSSTELSSEHVQIDICDLAIHSGIDHPT